MTQLLIATNNQGKVQELKALLSDLDIELVTPSQIGLDLDVVEDGTIYAENATKKAFAFAQASGLISLADDSGLEVDALDGEPGVYSARYGTLPPNPKYFGGAGEEQLLSFAERRKYLIKNLRGKPRPWTARFRATVAIAIPPNVAQIPRAERSGADSRVAKRIETKQHAVEAGDFRVTYTEGICEGEIIPEERGTGGFGYDPIFLLPELGKTMAELSMDEKNRLSHRARGVMKAKGILNELFSK